MQSWLLKLAHFWLHKVNPQIVSLIATIGTAGLFICLAIIYILAKLSEDILEQEAFSFDKTILLWIHQFANPTLDTLMVNITRLGNPNIVVCIALLVLAILWWQHYRQEAKIFFLNCLGGVILSYGLKLAFSRTRPQLWKLLISETSYSYPSGHALGSIVIYGFLSYLLATHYPKYAKIFYFVAAILILAIGLSRLYLGVHWPTDVIAGYGVGFLWITFCITMLNLQKTKSLST
ncbi:MAG: phosphatase PAP2 family protein [Spirulinaceae cyanobacterium]